MEYDKQKQKMSVYFLSILAGLCLSSSTFGQPSLTNPLICHDKDNYLRCYNDGNYVLKFAGGKFIDFRTFDNTLRYSESDKIMTFIKRKGTPDSLVVDTIQIILLPKSILLKKRTSSLEITSLNDLPKEIEDYGLGYYSINGNIRGLTFWSDDTYIELEVWTYRKTWSWDIIMKKKNKLFFIGYNPFKKNRVEHIFVEDDSLRYGMTISMTFKSLKKIRRLKSTFVDTISINGKPGIGEIKLDPYYKYEYRKSGKLKNTLGVAELKLCECY